MKQNTILIITGPTATGKTELAIDIAKKYNGEIISADSMQIYKYLDIGTAKPTLEEQSKIKHHLIDFVAPNMEYSVQQFVAEADLIIKDLFKKGKLPIIVGGTGLYIKSLIYPYTFCSAPKDENIRNKYKEMLAKEGKEYIYNLLLDRDSEAASKIHCNDTKRVIRALEINELTGKKKSELNLEDNNYKYNVIFVALDLPREQLYDRINKRVEKMFELGLLNEVKNVISSNLANFDNQSMQAIGYKEFSSFFSNEININELIELISKNSRNYAKRQITFIKGFKDVKWFNPIEERNEIYKFVEERLK